MLLHKELFTSIQLYLDPGTGSFLLQLLVAAVLGAGIAVRVFWSRIKTMITGKKPDSVEVEDKEQDD